MSDEIIDRVAKGILLCMNNMRGSKADVAHAAARLAVQLMREPTKEMYEAFEAQKDTGAPFYHGYRAAIDAALGDSVTVELPEEQKSL